MSGLAGCNVAKNLTEDPGSLIGSDVAETPASDTQTASLPSGMPLVGSDGKEQIALPAGWQEERSLHEDAQLQAFNPSKEMYVIVLSENKADLPEDMTLAKHSEITRNILTGNLRNSEVTGPTAVTKVGDYSATQYKIVGRISGIDVAYLHTTVETGDRFHQILTWTLPEDFDQNESELQTVIQSFREVR
jgi:hypothetical protein